MLDALSMSASTSCHYAGLKASRLWLTAPGFLIVVAFALIGGSPAGAVAASPIYPCDNERFGFGVTTNITSLDVASLHAGWYVNWGANPTAPHPAGMDYVPIIQTSDAGYSPNGSALSELVERNPGSLWLIGNEPDNPWQDPTQPANYARAYHDVYQFIKAQDPSAQIAIGGMTQATPLRLQWLDRVLQEYLTRYGEMIPVDVWNVHAFVLREVRDGHGSECAPPGATDIGSWGALIPPGLTANCGRWIEIWEHDRLDLMQGDIVRFRTWMRDHAQQDKPLFISEYAILFPEELGYSYSRVRDFMLGTFDYFLSARDPQLGYPADDYRLVQRWAWYSLDDYSFGFGTTHGALMDPRTGTLLPMGQDFASYTSNLLAQCPQYVDLQPFLLHISTPNPIRFGDIGLVRLALEVRNQGNSTAPPSRVSFWHGDPHSGGTLLGTVMVPSLPPRYEGSETATLDWSVAAYGSRTVTVQVDAAGEVAESREDNNERAYAVDFGSINLTAGLATWHLERGPLRPGETTQVTLGSVVVTTTQVTRPSPGLQIVPVSYRVTWTDGDPAANAPVIASYMMPAPKQFGVAQRIPAQDWTPVVHAPRSPVLTLALENHAPETTLGDNQAAVAISATTDLLLSAAEIVGGIPLVDPDTVRDMQIRFFVVNAGTVAPAAPLFVNVRSGTGPGGPEIGRVTLQQTGDRTEPLTWAGLHVGMYPFIAKVDPDNVIPESNEGNNTLAGTVLLATSRRYLPWSLH
jgi:hypothetical protein